jgi:pantoate--beta-alanine ligase
VITAWSRAGLAAALPLARAGRGSHQTSASAAVLTMGALHEGHLELIRRARAAVGETGVVTLSIFVNPLQFGPTEDLDRYPRTLDADRWAAEDAGVDLTFVPDGAAVYQAGSPRVTIDPGPLGADLEGRARPTHFRGVLTVVAKLLRLLEADLTPFGEKDYQQLVLVRQMLTELEQPTEVLSVPLVRDADGLALSSRNAYLSAAERAAALALPAALQAGSAAAPNGPEAVLTAARAVLDAEPAVAVDYLVLRDPELGAAPTTGPARLLVAARVGATRLLDNCAVVLGERAP